jgi:hypothetical protein
VIINGSHVAGVTEAELIDAELAAKAEAERKVLAAR